MEIEWLHIYAFFIYINIENFNSKKSLINNIIMYNDLLNLIYNLIKNIFGISFSIKSNYIFSSTRSYKSSSLKLFIFINNHINIKLNIRRRNNSSLLIIINNEMFMFNINFNLFAIKILINIEELVDIERVDNKSSFHHK
jgi:hypothetical protein